MYTSQWLDLHPEKMEAGAQTLGSHGPLVLQETSCLSEEASGLLFTQPRGAQETPTPKAVGSHLLTSCPAETLKS